MASIDSSTTTSCTPRTLGCITIRNAIKLFLIHIHHHEVFVHTIVVTVIRRSTMPVLVAMRTPLLPSWLLLLLLLLLPAPLLHSWLLLLLLLLLLVPVVLLSSLLLLLLLLLLLPLLPLLPTLLPTCLLLLLLLRRRV